MKKWKDSEGTEFKNSDLCFGREFKPDTDKVDIAKISIRGEYPEDKKWGYLLDTNEMAVVIKGKGYIESQKDGRQELDEGDVVSIEASERFRWGGNMDLIVTCGPAFNPKNHKFEESV